ncbi:PPE domain-containing protein [Nocardia higoensis]|uniref:PPE domain-containing protein n=1 Tax=Nocardia higoensis TaxID=228599 RepID=UPI00031FBC97|nr:hypothetical protein [Nocardia higoensis]
MREIPLAAERGEHTRTDPAYAPNAEVFDGLTHAEIFRNVQAIDPSLLSAGAQSWQATATGLADAVSQAHTEIRGAIADGWRGAASSTAAAAVAAFELQGRQLADVMAVVSQRLVRAAEAAEALRSAVGMPSAAQPDLAAALLDPAQATANVDTQKTVEGERLDVVRAMDTIYIPAFLGVGVDVPAFPDAVTATDAGLSSGAPGTAGATAPGRDDPAATVAAQAAVATTAAGNPAAPVSAAPAASAPVPSTALPTAGAAVGAPTGGPGGTVPARSASSDSTRRAGVAGAARAESAPTRATVPPTSAPTGSAPITGGPRPASDKERRRDGASTTAQAAAVDGAPAPDAPEATYGASVTEAGATAAALGTGAAGHETNPSGTDQSTPGTRGSDRDGESAVGAGAGAGAVGGLLGGALAAGDTPRSGSSVPANAARTERDRGDEDDELDWAEEDFVFDDLELAFDGGHGSGRTDQGFGASGSHDLDLDDSGFGDSSYGGSGYSGSGYGGSGYADLDPDTTRAPAGELIGDLDPATPPVVGDWTERE